MTTSNLTCWNVRTMYETGKQAQVIREMRAYKLHLLGISECRWTGCGKIKQVQEKQLYTQVEMMSNTMDE